MLSPQMVIGMKLFIPPPARDFLFVRACGVCVCFGLLIRRRSPSPPPQYDNFGRRVNTREYRYRKRLEDERHKLVDKAMKAIPNYHPPSDYRRPTKTQEKIYVPVNDYPEINFSILTPLLTILLYYYQPNFYKKEKKKKNEPAPVVSLTLKFPSNGFIALPYNYHTAFTHI